MGSDPDSTKLSKAEEIVDRITFLEAKVSRLEAALDYLYGLNDLGGSRLSTMRIDTLVELYCSVAEAREREEFSVENLIEFSEIFMKITEDEIRRLNEKFGFDDTWRPFYELCLKLMRYANEANGDDHDYQRARDLLYGGRKNLRAIAILFIERSAQTASSKQLLVHLASSDLEAFDAHVRQLKSVGRRGHMIIKK